MDRDQQIRAAALLAAATFCAPCEESDGNAVLRIAANLFEDYVRFGGYTERL